jgi:hypothetical protein
MLRDALTGSINLASNFIAVHMSVSLGFMSACFSHFGIHFSPCAVLSPSRAASVGTHCSKGAAHHRRNGQRTRTPLDLQASPATTFPCDPPRPLLRRIASSFPETAAPTSAHCIDLVLKPVLAFTADVFPTRQHLLPTAQNFQVSRPSFPRDPSCSFDGQGSNTSFAATTTVARRWCRAMAIW